MREDRNDEAFNIVGNAIVPLFREGERLCSAGQRSTKPGTMLAFSSGQELQKLKSPHSTALRGPIGSFLVHGVNDDGKTEPLALVALTPPHLATGDAALLQFVIRRAQAATSLSLR